MKPGDLLLRTLFGPFALDPEARQLHRDGSAIPLSPKAFGLLELLLAERPKVVAKSEIFVRLWPKTFVSDASVARLANELRVALGDDARHPSFVRTVHGHGYAFCGQAFAEGRVPRPIRSFCHIVRGSQVIPLRLGENVVGRAPDSAVVIQSERVSRHHACIRVSAASVTIEDLGSKNGTFVRGERVEAEREMCSGDEILVGPVVLEFRSIGGMSTTKTGER